MPVRFVLGRAGTGKTHHCFEAAWEECRQRGLDARVFLLLPPQATFMAERRLACLSQRTLAGVQVVSFESLVRELAGQDTRLAVSAQGRRLVLSNLLRQNAAKLKYFGKSATQLHLAARIDAALSEIESAGLTVDDIELGLAGEQSVLPTISDKLHDLRLMHDAWEAFLGQDRVDPARRLREAAGRIEASDQLKGALVLVDGFATFTAVQRRILLTIAKVCRRMDICLMMEPGSPVVAGVMPAGEPLRFGAESAYIKLRDLFRKEAVAIEPTLGLWQQRRATNPGLAALQARWGQPASEALAAGEIRLIEASSPRDEVEAVARQIRHWQQQGFRLREIGVFARQIGPYRPWVSAIFSEYGIPCFIDQRRSMSHHALLRWIRAVLSIMRLKWRQETVIELLKTGLLPLSDDEADRLENFALLHGIDREKWVQREPWRFTSRPIREDEQPDEQTRQELLESQACDELRCRALGPIRQFVGRVGDAPHTAREMVAELYRLLSGDELGIRASLARWMEAAVARGDVQLRAEHKQAWVRVMAVLDEVVQLLGDQTMDARALAQSLEAAMEGFDLAITPPTVDQVLVGQIDRSRSPEFRAVIVMGMNDGMFPARADEDQMFSDAERQALTARGLELARDPLRAILEERELAYIALTRAAEVLVLTRHTADETGTEMPPSPLLGEIERIVPLTRDSADGWIGGIATRSGAVQRWAEAAHLAELRKGAEPLPDGAADLQKWLCADPASRLWMDAAGRGLRHHNDAQLSQGVVDRLFGRTLQASVSRLEAFAACPFKHFAQYTLRLQQREVAEVTAMDLGNVFHNVLELLVRRMVRDKLRWSDEPVTQMIPELVEEIGQTLRGQLMLSSQRNRYLLDHVRRTVEKVLADQRFMDEHKNRLRPAGAEVDFGPGGQLPPLILQTPAHRELILRGRIDRVDLVEDQAKAAVYDYKLNEKRLALDQVYHGLTLQLLTYLLVLREHGHKLAGKPVTPVAAFYVQLLRKLKKVTDVADEPEDCLSARPRGLIDTDAADDLGECDEKGKSQLFSFQVDDQGAAKGQHHGDAANHDQFDALLEHVQTTLATMADDVLSGQVDIHPYMHGKRSPCPFCDYRSLCRFEPAASRYRPLATMRRDAVLELLAPKNPGEGPSHV